MYPLENVWPEWQIVRNLGEGSYGKVYEVVRNDLGGSFRAALKVISIPKNRSEYESILREGMDERSATSYFHGMMADIVKEFALMEKLKGNTNIVAYEDHSIVQHEDGRGWDVLIRMEYLTPFNEYIKNHSLSEEDIIRFGKDISRALSLCEKHQIIHRDIKPENIFVSDLGDFKLGDFGIARTINLVTDMSQKGTYNYMAPEVYRGGSYDATVDIYSLGIVLYRLLNNNRLPFMPPYPQEITYTDKENAVFRRLSCEQLPLPAQGSPLLQNVVMRACQPNPLYRYRTAEDMLYDLECIERGDSSERFYYSAQETASRFDKTEELVPDNSEQERPVSVANNIGLIDQWQEHRLKKAQEKELRQEVIREHKRKKRKRRRVIRLLLVLVLLLFLLREKALIDKGESEKSVIVKLSDMAEQKIESFWETLMSDYGIPQEISDLVIPPGK